MRNTFTLFILCCLFVTTSNAQQDPMFTKYMFNALVYNPGYAGSKDFLSAALLHRSQWMGIEGAPSTQTLSVHTPLKNDRVGLGFHAINDVIGPTNSITAQLSYAYRIPVGKKARLSVGLNGGVTNWRADWSEIETQNPNDDAFAEDQPSYWLPNFGVGLYFFMPRFYFGISSPHLIEYDLREENINTDVWARQYRHYYLSIGGAIPVAGDNVVFRPSLLVKNTGLFSDSNKDEAFRNVGAPTEVDVDLSFLFYQTFWIGASFRSAVEKFTDDSSSYDSVDLWMSYLLNNGLRIGAAYDYSLNELNSVTNGSFEVMLGYEFNFNNKEVLHIRYF